MKTAIVDDDPIVCSSLETILSTTGAADVLWTADNAEDAEKLYFSQPSYHPDVLLLDIQMPGTDGLQLAQSILSKDKTARLLFLTTFADKTYIQAAMRLGAKGYLIKQDVSSVGPSLQAVMAGQIVMGTQVVQRLSTLGSDDMSSTEQLFSQLGERDRALVQLVAQGFDNKDIAATLFLSEGTVRNRISFILEKLNLSNRTQLAIEWVHTH